MKICKEQPKNKIDGKQKHSCVRYNVAQEEFALHISQAWEQESFQALTEEEKKSKITIGNQFGIAPNGASSDTPAVDAAAAAAQQKALHFNYVVRYYFCVLILSSNGIGKQGEKEEKSNF